MKSPITWINSAESLAGNYARQVLVIVLGTLTLLVAFIACCWVLVFANDHPFTVGIPTAIVLTFLVKAYKNRQP